MDSPLNLTHRCHRRAEYYLNDHRFKEAIDCHLRAANHITEALLTTRCETMRSSLETQKEFHLSQEKVLKQREFCENQKILNYRQELINRQLLRQRFGSNSDNNSLQNPIQSENSPTEANHKMDNKPNVMSEILDVMSEHDSLLQFLIQKQSTVDPSPTTEEVEASGETGVVSSSSSDSMYKSGAKKPKDDKTVIEELQTVNEKLRQLVFQLFGELESSHKENNSLRTENQKLKDENRLALSSVVPELPPLEPPALLY